jgi:hypothetical protein
LRKEKEDAENYTLLGTQKVADGYAAPNYYRYPCAAFAPWGMLLEYELFQKPGFAEQNKLDYAIVYVRSVQEKAENIVLIKAEIRNPTTNGHGDYIVKFLPDSSWAVKEVVFDSTDSLEKSTCTYDGEIDGVPLLKTLVSEKGRAKKDGGGLVSKEEFIVTKIIPGAIPLAEFEVQQFLPIGD